MENQEQNIEQQPNTKPADSGDKGNGKMFTQEDVDRIVRDRLAREKAKAPAQDPEVITKREAELTARESRLSCREYLVESGYPAELLDVVDTSNIDEFKKRADTVARLMNHSRNLEADPLANIEHRSCTALGSFEHPTKHTPRQYPPRYDGE